MILAILTSCLCAGLIATSGNLWPGAPAAAALVIFVTVGTMGIRE